MLLRPVHPIHHDLALLRRLEVRGDRAVAADRGRPRRCCSSPTLDPTRSTSRVFAVAIWGAYLIRTMYLWSSAW